MAASPARATCRFRHWWREDGRCDEAQPGSRGLRVGPAGGLDVLVDVEGVAWVIAVLDLGEPTVIAAVGRFYPVLALVHQEVDVGAAGRGRVQVCPVVPGPLRD